MLDSFVKQVIGSHFADYEERAGRAVQIMARYSALDPDFELARFQRVMDQLRKVPDPEKLPSDTHKQVQYHAARAAPNVLEFALSFASEGFGGFAYMTEGRAGYSLPVGLSAQFENSARLMLTEGLDLGHAEIFADVFREVFPNVEGLGLHSVLAQAMLVGFVPGPQSLGQKVYFNTRIDSSSSHDAKIENVIARLGLSSGTIFPALYQSDFDVAFRGIGIDFISGRDPRMKMYVKLDYQLLPSLLNHLSQSISAMDVSKMEERCLSFLDKFACDSLLPTLELAIGLTEKVDPTLKLTAFFDSESTSAPSDRLLDFARSQLVDVSILEEVFEALSLGVSESKIKHQPVHGVGIELSTAQSGCDEQKFNAYLQPLI